MRNDDDCDKMPVPPSMTKIPLVARPKFRYLMASDCFQNTFNQRLEYSRQFSVSSRWKFWHSLILRSWVKCILSEWFWSSWIRKFKIKCGIIKQKQMRPPMIRTGRDVPNCARIIWVSELWSRNKPIRQSLWMMPSSIMQYTVIAEAMVPNWKSRVYQPFSKYSCKPLS